MVIENEEQQSNNKILYVSLTPRGVSALNRDGF